ncbi:DUF3592 domain-containing protein [Mycolicibacterium sp. CBMA 234]|uniref:DUF3592 domain-containing protein n=1 Tax=Mycolicibacterium sp. CBMA 234 TaxID=1918495 RepID=UPI0012DE0A33
MAWQRRRRRKRSIAVAPERESDTLTTTLVAWVRRASSSGRPPYDVTRRIEGSRNIPRYQPGATVAVWVDPKRPNRILIDERGPTAPPHWNANNPYGP